MPVPVPVAGGGSSCLAALLVAVTAKGPKGRAQAGAVLLTLSSEVPSAGARLPLAGPSLVVLGVFCPRARPRGTESERSGLRSCLPAHPSPSPCALCH